LGGFKLEFPIEMKVVRGIRKRRGISPGCKIGSGFNTPVSIGIFARNFRKLSI
jgi:hypothetical protein